MRAASRPSRAHGNYFRPSTNCYKLSERHYLWRAVDQNDNVLEILVQGRRNKQAAQKFFRKLLTGLHYLQRVVITEKFKSYGAAKRERLKFIPIKSLAARD